ncbi:mediator of RNA polymerase II transcription subunit 14 [Fusarium mexicanum]|uniref:Glucose-6-phosphate 1-dehydrogenase n=1 Tax=Fusarium mexicanum TaxID=751941 RepID=A0A8H5I6X8_9HYPO|nr:mediator of RNA polymerase II transcription subunit 14 [Fusarium mexicanum]
MASSSPDPGKTLLGTRLHHSPIAHAGIPPIDEGGWIWIVTLAPSAAVLSFSSRCMELKQNTTIVVLGASGDLAKKKTYPALFGLYRNQFLPKDVKIVGYARTKMDHDEYIRRIKSYIKTPTKEIEQQLEEFAGLCTYVSGQYDKDESFQGLEQHLQEVEQGRPENHRLFYMALPPSVFTIVSQHLKKICYPKNGVARVIVEKPFGKDLASSRELQKSLEPDWNEQELFRIDHYLGKEMVKNILILRFGNSFLGATWNRHHIDNVQITFKEPFGTEGRGGYFDEFGIVRDVMQNHLLQVLTLLAMERPISFNAEDIRDEKVRVLRAIPAIEPKNVIIGQYGKSLDGSKPAYREDDTVPKDSRCPTFCALVAYIKNERWDGVPFIMKAGKALNEQKTEIRIQFKDVTSGIFKDIPRNELVMRIQPNESVYIKMNSKLPGLSMQTVVTELDLTYRRRFSDLKIPEAYESLVLDCLKGDQSNFVRDDELDASWRIFTPLLHYLDDNKEIIPMEYPYGSRGPAVLDDFTSSYGYKFSDAAGYQWPTTNAAAPNKLMSDPAGEIVHITQGYIPLSKVLTRLAQSTHNALQDQIAALAKMPLPPAAMNGNSTVPNSDVEDGSGENTAKKTSILNFAMREHRKWVKALVITEWSRKADMVSKLIDLRFHLQGQEVLFSGALDVMGHVKRDLTFARMPSPDLKTALQVLSTGEAAWMPDLSYIEPPPLTRQEQIQWISDLDTQLSLRLNLEDFDKIPYHFRNYEIDSGRVTFKVAGEFEVDLTIADEDFEKQFWFIDFRFAFEPAASSIPDGLKNYLEGQVNDILSKDGLLGCYQFLHELVLTHKLNELKRQASQLSRGSWTGTLKVEPLNRALAIQYWTSRTQLGSPKSWILIAVNSGRKPNGQPGPKSSSHLMAKWYRDNKEVKDTNISFDADNLSAETLLKTVIGRHVEFLLGSIHSRLQAFPRFQNRDAAMILNISHDDPATSFLSMQVGYKDSASLLVEPTTGVFAVKPHSKFTIQHEHLLNNGKNPADDGATCLENVRCGVMEDELIRRGSTTGWTTKKSPMSKDELRSLTNTREWTKTIWLQRTGWDPNWFIMVLLSPSGDAWWLVDVSRNANGQSNRLSSKLPLNKGYPHLEDEFWNNLTLFATGMIAQAVDQHELYRHNIKFLLQDTRNWSLPQQVRLPTLEISLSDIFPSMVFNMAEKDNAKAADESNAVSETSRLGPVAPTASTSGISTRQPWAHDIVSIRFKGIEPVDKEASGAGGPISDVSFMCVSDAIIKVRKPAKFAMLKGHMVGRDVSWKARTGEFCLRMRSNIGRSILENLKARVKAVDRFVSFFESLDKARGFIKAESVSLKEVTFSYGPPASQEVENAEASRLWRVALDLSNNDIDIQVQETNPHLPVTDLMQKLVNGANGIGALMDWLPVSLPTMEAFKKIREAWSDIEARREGRFKFVMNSTDEMSFEYLLAGTGPGNQQVQRSITFLGQIKQRRGEPWWHIERKILSGGWPSSNDGFSAALKPVWDGKGNDWRGLVTGAAGRPENGIIDLLLAIDEAIRPLTGSTFQNNSEVVILE